MQTFNFTVSSYRLKFTLFCVESCTEKINYNPLPRLFFLFAWYLSLRCHAASA